MITSKQINVNNRKVAIFVAGPVCFLMGATAFMLAFLKTNSEISSSIARGLLAGLIFSMIMIYYDAKKWNKTLSNSEMETEKKNQKRYRSISIVVGIIILFFLGFNMQLEIFLLSVAAGIMMPISLIHILKALLRKGVFQKEVPGFFDK